MKKTIEGGTDKIDDICYTGITKQKLSVRLGQHRRAGRDFARLDPFVDGLTRNQARAIETYEILNGKKRGLNRILSISMRHKYFDQAMAWASEMINGG